MIADFKRDWNGNILTNEPKRRTRPLVLLVHDKLEQPLSITGVFSVMGYLLSLDLSLGLSVAGIIISIPLGVFLGMMLSIIVGFISGAFFVIGYLCFTILSGNQDYS
jgi:hypothetical protein